MVATLIDLHTNVLRLLGQSHRLHSCLQSIPGSAPCAILARTTGLKAIEAAGSSQDRRWPGLGPRRTFGITAYEAVTSHRRTSRGSSIDLWFVPVGFLRRIAVGNYSIVCCFLCVIANVFFGFSSLSQKLQDSCELSVSGVTLQVVASMCINQKRPHGK